MNKAKIILSTIAAGFLCTQANAQDHQRPDPQEMTALLFTEFDINEDGAFGPNELTTALIYMQSQRPQHRRVMRGDSERKGPTVSDTAMAIYNRHDSNRDGLLQENEFLSAMHSRRQQQRISQG